MSSAKSIIQQDPYYIDSRRKELQQYIDFFSHQLYNIYCVMPAPKIVLNLSTGEWSIINDEKWQSLIDKTLKEQSSFLEKTFPEFYNF